MILYDKTEQGIGPIYRDQVMPQRTKIAWAHLVFDNGECMSET